MRGFIGQEATHADVHEQMLHEYMVANGIDPAPMLEQIEFLFTKTLAPTTSTDPKRRLNHLCDRLWFIAAIEHYTAVMGDFALNCAWDDYGADPTMVDMFRWHGSEEVEHRSVAHDVAVYFHDSYVDRIRAMAMAVVAIFVFFQRTSWFLVKSDPNVDIGWWRFNRLRMRDSKIGLLPKYRKLFGSNTAMYFRPGSPPTRWVPRRRRSLTSPVPPRPARHICDRTARPLPPGAAERLRASAPRHRAGHRRYLGFGAVGHLRCG